MSGFLSWLKSNIVIVILAILTIVPLPVAWYLSSGMNKSLREDRQSEAQKALRDINGATVSYALPTLSVDEPPIEDSSPPNSVKTQFYKAEREKREAIISKVKERAVEFNSKGRSVLLDGLFPEPASLASGQLLQPQFAEMVIATGGDESTSAYDRLFDRLRINEPVDTETLREQLAARKAALMNQLAPGTAEGEMDEATREQIKQQLVEQRLGTYETHARDTSFYANADILPGSVLRVAPLAQPSLSDCFNWQFNYWVIEDVLGALVSANDSFDSTGVGGSVLDGVVKQVESIEFAPLVTIAASQGSNTFEETGYVGGDAEARARADRLNQVDRNFGSRPGGGFVESGTITGRSTEESGLYDVVPVTVTMIASYEKLPKLFDAVASHNFMTVLDADIYAVDQWEQIEQGFYAGTDYIVRVEMTIETLWLRNWTKEFMPTAVREQLGIPTDEFSEDPA
ncbi:MAG: hypothetical protein ED559_12185 [Phycisphaera sp.]|nr:MAG: hypothetical protein ED559_12185 [Phycisphaera sp.]